MWYGNGEEWGMKKFSNLTPGIEENENRTMYRGASLLFHAANEETFPLFYFFFTT